MSAVSGCRVIIMRRAKRRMMSVIRHQTSVTGDTHCLSNADNTGDIIKNSGMSSAGRSSAGRRPKLDHREITGLLPAAAVAAHHWPSKLYEALRRSPGNSGLSGGEAPARRAAELAG